MGIAMSRRKLKDIVGQTFGNWLVLKRIEKNKTTHWECRCDCGRIAQIRNDAIYRAKKCGHIKHIDLTGKRFGSFLVLKKDGITKERAMKWQCLCDCGNVVSVIGYNLRHGDSKSCGCKRSELNSIALTIPNNGSYLNKMYFRYKYDATVRNDRTFNLTKEQFYKIIQKECHYCGKLSDPFNPNSNNINGIDRIDSNEGYYIENCVPCCSQCNISKNKMSYDEFINWINRVHNHINNKVPALFQLQ